MFGGQQAVSLTGSTRKDFSNIYHVAIMAFRMSLIDENPYHVSLNECMVGVQKMKP